MAPEVPAYVERVARLPRQPGVYNWKDANGTILYVGKALDLRARVSSYLDPQGGKTSALMQEAADLDVTVVQTEKDALLLEQTQIKLHRPRYNVRLNDDKQYPYLKLTKEPYPRLLKVHRREDDGATYFGPFPDGYGAWHVLQALGDLFPLRRCKVLPKEKCLYLDIGKCAGPCVAACTDAEYDLLVAEVREVLEGRTTHLMSRMKQRVAQAAAAHRFEEAARLRDQLGGLEGVLERQHMVHERLEDRDVAALAAQGDAAIVVLVHQRDGKVTGQTPFVLSGVAPGEETKGLVEFLRGLYQDRPVPRHVAADLDEATAAQLESDLRLLRGQAVTVERPQKGDKRRWLEVAHANAELRLQEELLRRRKRGAGAVEALQHALALKDPPRRIEGFDVSHRDGQFTRAAMVSFLNGAPDKASYRTFNMRTVGQAAVDAGTATSKGRGREVDDFASIGEAVGRRYARLKEEGLALPDLVLIDGGPGQLAAARDALQAVGLGHLPLCSLAKEDEEVFVPNRLRPLKLAGNDPALQLLQRVRDEAHRFGIKQVRRKATASTMESPLDDVPGVGPKRRAQLVKTFGGLEGLRTASVEDLQRVKGITPAIAQKVREVLGVEAPAPSDANHEDHETHETD